MVIVHAEVVVYASRTYIIACRIKHVYTLLQGIKKTHIMYTITSQTILSKSRHSMLRCEYRLHSANIIYYGQFIAALEQQNREKLNVHATEHHFPHCAKHALYKHTNSELCWFAFTTARLEMSRLLYKTHQGNPTTTDMLQGR